MSDAPAVAAIGSSLCTWRLDRALAIAEAAVLDQPQRLHTSICHSFCNALPPACRPRPPNCPQSPPPCSPLLPLFLSPAEDFFFRTVHLGTDCWALIALSRVASAQAFAEGGNWHLAAARSAQVRRQAGWERDPLGT